MGTGGHNPTVEKAMGEFEAQALPAGQPRTPNPMTRHILAPGAGLFLPPPGTGRGAAAWSCRAAVPSTPGTRVARGPTHHLQIARRTASQHGYRQQPRRSLPFPGLLPPHPPEVRPSGRGRKEGAGCREGAARGRGSHACGLRGPGTEGAARVWLGGGGSGRAVPPEREEADSALAVINAALLPLTGCDVLLRVHRLLQHSTSWMDSTFFIRVSEA